MRRITPQLPPILEKSTGGKVAHHEGVIRNNYRDVVHLLAQIAVCNKDFLLFFRGQSQDYKTRAGGSTFYPSIYRGDRLGKTELQTRFSILYDAENQLLHNVKAKKFLSEEEQGEIKRKKFIRWSILQHYEVCHTPLLDFTHSIRVACSFAQHNSSNKYCYVYAFALPYMPNRISINSEHDLINIRLIGICPSSALRPYFQDGYLAGTTDIEDDFDSKGELDFSNRLVCKIRIPSGAEFWGSGFSRIPDEILYPQNDKFKRICDRISPSAQVSGGILASFMAIWVPIERMMIELATPQTGIVPTTIEAINLLGKGEVISSELRSELHALRKLRNKIVHGGQIVGGIEEQPTMARLRRARAELEQIWSASK